MLDSRLIAVRWLGAFRGRRFSPAEVGAWELAPTREVAAEVYSRSGGSRIRRALVGLVIDTDRTPLRRWYASDVWTEASEVGGRVLSPERGNRIAARDWGNIRASLARRGHHSEAIVYSPVYRAVIAPKDNRFGAEIAAAMGLPLTTPRQEGRLRSRRGDKRRYSS